MSHDSFSVCNAKIANQETQTKFFHKNSRFFIILKYLPGLSQPRQIDFIKLRRIIVVLQKHCHINRGIDNTPVNTQIVIVQHKRIRNVIIRTGKDIVQCPMLRIVFSRLHFYRQHTALHLYDKIQFTAFLVVVVVCVEPVRRQFLRHGILIDRAIIDVASPFNNAQLDAFSILCGEQPHITLK